MLLNNQWITEEIKEEIKKKLLKSDNENNDLKAIEQNKSSSKKEVYAI